MCWVGVGETWIKGGESSQRTYRHSPRTQTTECEGQGKGGRAGCRWAKEGRKATSVSVNKIIEKEMQCLFALFPDGKSPQLALEVPETDWLAHKTAVFLDKVPFQPLQEGQGHAARSQGPVSFGFLNYCLFWALKWADKKRQGPAAHLTS